MANLFDDDEMKIIIMAAVAGRDRRTHDGISREDIDKIVKWAHEARVEATILEAVLNEKMLVDIDENDEIVLFAVEKS